MKGDQRVNCVVETQFRHLHVKSLRGQIVFRNYLLGVTQILLPLSTILLVSAKHLATSASNS